MRRVLLESPYSGDIPRNTKYARQCMLHSLKLGEAPMVSHLLYTQVLDDDIVEQRRVGIEAGHSFIPYVSAVVVYQDYGISLGMTRAIAMADALNVRVEYRNIMSEENDAQA